MAKLAEADGSKPPAPDRSAGPQESPYRPEMSVEICQRLRNGETLAQIAADPALPGERTIYRWLNRHPEFWTRYERVRDELGLERARRRALVQAHQRRVRAHRRAEAGKPPRDWVAGRRSSYRRGWAEAFCARLKAGEAAYRISRDPGMPTRTQISTWLKTVPEFRELYVEARRFHQGWLAFQIDRVVDDVEVLGLARAKAEVARLEGRIGRLRAKVWRQVPRV